MDNQQKINYFLLLFYSVVGTPTRSTAELVLRQIQHNQEVQQQQQHEEKLAMFQKFMEAFLNANKKD